jgi:hypothetical protein
MEIFLAFPILGGLLILQSGILSRLPLMHGTTDLVMLAIIAWGLQKRVGSAWVWGIIGGLLVGYATAVPFIVYLIGYMLIIGTALIFRLRAANVPILSMLTATFLGTLIIQALTLLVLRLMDRPLPVLVSINQIVLPSLLLNMILALPFFLVFRDLANLLHPESLEV